MTNFAEQVRRMRQQPDEVLPALTVLDRFCREVGEGWDGKVRLWRERGYLTNLGQEWRIMMASKPETAPGHVMLRAHVPSSGFPVRLDVYAEELVECRDEAALRTALSDFLDQPATQDNLRLLAVG